MSSYLASTLHSPGVGQVSRESDGPARQGFSLSCGRCRPISMFDQTWKWAGIYRKTEKNLGVPVHQIHEKLAQLLGNAAYWLDKKTYEVDEGGVPFPHELVVIHAFPNGNGRHARLSADVVAVKGGPRFFSWGR